MTSATEIRRGDSAPSTTEVVVSSDADGSIVSSSAAFEDVFGYAPHEMLGRPMALLIAEDHRERYRAAVARIADGAPPHAGETLEVNGQHKEGELFPVELSVSRWSSAGHAFVTNIVRDRAGWGRAAAALRVSEECYRLLVEHSPDAILVHRAGLVIFVNETGTRLLFDGLRPADLAGQPLARFVSADDHAKLARHLAPVTAERALAERTTAAEPAQFLFVSPGGATVDVEAVSSHVLYQGEPAVQMVVRDITARRVQEHAMHEAERLLRDAEQRARRMADRMTAVAAAAARVLGTDSLEALHQVLGEACESVVSFDTFTFSVYDEEANALVFVREPSATNAVDATTVSLTGRLGEIVVRERRSVLTLSASDPMAAGGAMFAEDQRSESIIRSPIYTAEGVLGVLAVQSYTPDMYGAADVEVLEAIAALAATAIRNQRLVKEIRRTHEQLAHQAFHDPLTGLANRTLFISRVADALARPRARADTVAVLFLDLDNFKNVNDSLGHAEGDRLIIHAADRILNATRGCDTVARLGGDEFAILLANVHSDADTAIVAGRIIGALGAPFALAGSEALVSASIGVARASPGAVADELLRDADTAMYTAKSRGKGQFVAFKPAMHAAAVGRLELEADLRRAVASDEFRLYYQPIVDLTTNALVGVEALVRWSHPERGLVNPGQFVSFTEATGLIVPIGRWVLREACRQAAAWQRADVGGQPLQIAVNLSGRQLHEASLVEDVRQTLADTGLAPRLLTLEVTEDVMMDHTDITLARLHDLRELGVQLAVDNFGVGYSSLSHLQSFPIDMLKIDKTFVDVVGQATDQRMLAGAIVAIGRAMQLTTIAEGIENAEQAAELARMGCALGQGYFWTPPLTAEELGRRLGAGPNWAQLDIPG